MTRNEIWKTMSFRSNFKNISMVFWRFVLYDETYIPVIYQCQIRCSYCLYKCRSDIRQFLWDYWTGKTAGEINWFVVEAARLVHVLVIFSTVTMVWTVEPVFSKWFVFAKIETNSILTLLSIFVKIAFILESWQHMQRRSDSGRICWALILPLK